MAEPPIGDLADRLLSAKEKSGKTFDQIADELGFTNTYTTQLLLGQAQLKPDTLPKLKKAVPGISETDLEALQKAPCSGYGRPHLLMMSNVSDVRVSDVTFASFISRSSGMTELSSTPLPRKSSSSSSVISFRLALVSASSFSSCSSVASNSAFSSNWAPTASSHSSISICRNTHTTCKSDLCRANLRGQTGCLVLTLAMSISSVSFFMSLRLVALARFFFSLEASRSCSASWACSSRACSQIWIKSDKIGLNRIKIGLKSD